MGPRLPIFLSFGVNLTTTTTKEVTVNVQSFGYMSLYVVVTHDVLVLHLLLTMRMNTV